MHIRALIILIAVLSMAVLALSFHYPSETWDRPSPLSNPIQVINVQAGILTLADGTKVTPIGIKPSGQVSQEIYDNFLRIATAQGVQVIEQTVDGRAIIQAEPKFYNWCGNCRGSRNWAGTYVTCDLSALAIRCNYAEPDTTQTGLSLRLQWLLDGILSLRYDDEPVRINPSLNALRYDSIVFEFEDIDRSIELMTETKAPD